MSVATSKTVESAITVFKFAIAFNHIKNNRIEYLVLLLLSHMVGATNYVIDHAQGVCFPVTIVRHYLPRFRRHSSRS